MTEVFRHAITYGKQAIRVDGPTSYNLVLEMKYSGETFEYAMRDMEEVRTKIAFLQGEIGNRNSEIASYRDSRVAYIDPPTVGV